MKGEESAYAVSPSKKLLKLVEDYNKPVLPFDADAGLSRFSRIREMAQNEGLACITTPAQRLYVCAIKSNNDKS